MAEFVDRNTAAPVAQRRGAVKMLERAATGFAVAGGFIFCALIAMSLVSIIGRKLFSSPIQGDVELMQMGAAIGAAAFLPICEMHDNNIKVDALTGWLPSGIRAVLDTVAHLLLALAAAAMTWRTGMAVMDAYASGEVSTLLSVPMWQPVALLVPSLALLSLCGACQVMLSLPKAVRSAS